MFNLCKLLCVYPDISLFSHFPAVLLYYKTWLFWGNNTLQSFKSFKTKALTWFCMFVIFVFCVVCSNWMAAISAVFVFAWFCTFVMFVFCVVCSDWITAIFPAFVFTWFFVVLYSVSFASSSQLPTFAVVFHKYPWFVFGASGKLLTLDKINVSDVKSYYTYFWSP